METEIVLEEIDLKIIRILQFDARKSFSEIAEELHVSLDTISYRFRRLREMGVIKGSTLMLDFKKIPQYSVILEVETVCGKEELVLNFIYQTSLNYNVSVSFAWSVGGYSISGSLFAKDSQSLGKFVEKLRTNKYISKMVTTQISDFYHLPEAIDLRHLLRDGKKHG